MKDLHFSSKKRNCRVRSFLLVLGLLTGGYGISSAQIAKSLTGVSITVADLDKAISFYTNVLPFQHTNTYHLKGANIQRFFGVQDPTLVVNVAELKLGEEHLTLMDFESTELGRSIPFDSKSNDLWFQHIAIVVSDMENAYRHLLDHKVVHVSTAPQILPDYLPAAAGISAFYFRDPDGHNLELIHFPKGKGYPNWLDAGDNLFLGIDHSAIGIEDTDKSLSFYRDILEMQVVGNSENYGSEQEHLNQVFGARLLITGLKAQNGFGLEFLDYIAPPGGRPYPADSAPNDLWHWHTSIKVTDAAAIYEKILEENYTMISSGLIDLKNTALKVKQGFLFRGPDGHALFLYE